MLTSGVLERATGPYASPMHIVPKDGSKDIRIVGDFRALNQSIVKDTYQIPGILEFPNKMKDAKFFSTLDLKSGFHQLPLAKEDRQKPTLCTPWGSFNYTRCCFGLSNSPQSMQRLTDWLTSDLDKVQGYVDDFLVFSATSEERESHLRQLFRKFHDAGLKINPKKTVLGCSEVTFCGYLISEDGIKPPPEKLQAIEDYPEPTTV